MSPADACGKVADPGLPLCVGHALEERGKAWAFDVLEHGRPVRAFALRFDGTVHAYLNRCAHVPVEMDWQPGDFLDSEQRVILCSIHGAAYEPANGRCVGGPCGRGRLTALRTEERGGMVYWYPSHDIRPAASAPGLKKATDEHP